MPRAAQASDQVLEMNWGPWSVVSNEGTPKRETQCSTKARMQDAAVMSFSGTASTHLVVLSMRVRT